MYAAFMEQKALGKNHLAYDMAHEFFREFGKYEIEIERYFDHAMFCSCSNIMLKKRPRYIFETESENERNR